MPTTRGAVKNRSSITASSTSMHDSPLIRKLREHSRVRVWWQEDLVKPLLECGELATVHSIPFTQVVCDCPA